MSKQSSSIFLVRHCKATGQEADAPLTPEGESQAQALADFLALKFPKRIVSSTYLRATRSIQPTADRLGLTIEKDPRLTERLFGEVGEVNWRLSLRRSFEDLDFSLPGGEPPRIAIARGRKAVDSVFEEKRLPAVIVTHGELLARIAYSYDNSIGFNFWEKITNPDVFELRKNAQGVIIQRVWG